MNADTSITPFGSFRPAEVQASLARNRTPFAEYVNPLMTSMQCLNFPGNERSVEGRDFFDTSSEENPDFFGHNHVLIPYCSSDLWLGDELRPGQEALACECGDLDCFRYQPESEELQFAFRGRRIFQSTFKQLMANFSMSEASEILIGGSSAGGVGAFNHAQWVRRTMPEDSELLVLLDSSWFINFQDNIFRIFDGSVSMRNQTDDQASDASRLFNIISNHTSCRDDAMGFPCCISAHCVMTTRDASGALAYFPSAGTRTFVFQSVYDVFLLAPAVVGLDDFEGTMTDDGNENVTALLIDFLRLVGEYGGEMNFTLGQAFRDVSTREGVQMRCLCSN